VGNEPNPYLQIKGLSIFYVNLRSVNVSPPVDPSGVHSFSGPTTYFFYNAPFFRASQEIPFRPVHSQVPSSRTCFLHPRRTVVCRGSSPITGPGYPNSGVSPAHSDQRVAATCCNGNGHNGVPAPVTSSANSPVCLRNGLLYLHIALNCPFVQLPYHRTSLS
jgi:hypothetical protein